LLESALQIMGDKLHLKLNITQKPIEHKYRKGKFKRTLKRELKEPKVVNQETLLISLIQCITII